MSRQILGGPGIPSQERRAQGPVACIECFQQIPCNPCEEACPRGAITVGDAITALPRLDEEKCNGCGLCMTRCPGLAIFTVDESGGGDKARVSFPYEYVPLLQKGQEIACTDREGRFVTKGTIYQVLTSKAFDHTAIVTVEIPKAYSMEVRFIQCPGTEPRKDSVRWKPVNEKTARTETYVPDEDNIYVCRCEEVTVGDIKRAIAAGADSLRALKMRTNAGMGVCQGLTCRRNIERMLQEQKIDLDICHSRSQRFPVRLLNVGEFAQVLEEAEEKGVSP